MKGIILSGGLGTRMYPLTKVTSKQLLPVYNRPMIFYPLEKLLAAGIRDILIIVAPDHCGDYMRVLGSGKEYGAKFTYEIQDKPEGLAQAYLIAEDFIANDSVAMILGDNIFEDSFEEAVQNFKSGGLIFTKEVPDPERFGVVKFDENMRAIQIVEKPKEFLSNHAITGMYIFDNRVVEAAKNSKPSARGEMEITDIHNWYLEKNQLEVRPIKGAWLDAGTFETYYRAGVWAYEREQSGNSFFKVIK